MLVRAHHLAILLLSSYTCAASLLSSTQPSRASQVLSAMANGGEAWSLESMAPSTPTENTPSRVVSYLPSALSSASADNMALNRDLPVMDSPMTPTDGTLPPVPQVTGCRTHGQIALTFSGGPSDATARIAHQLNNAQVRANFFINASWLETQQYAMVVQNMYNAGHLIGMAYRAPSDDPTALTDQELRDDIIKNARMIETLIQVAPKYVRLQHTPEADVRTQNILRDLGFVLVEYNLDGLDYIHKTPSEIEEVFRGAFRRQKDTYDAKGSFISIQYDIPGTGSLSSIPQIVNAIDQEGYTAVRMDGCLNDPNPYKASASLLQYVHDKFSFNTTGYRQGQKPVAIVTNVTEEDDRGLSAEMESDATRNSAVHAAAMSELVIATLFFVSASAAHFLI